jgi:hypothetical protein
MYMVVKQSNEMKGELIMREILTAERISELTADLDGLANITAINKLYREQDESNLWPISGRFNCTERAIRQARKYQSASGAVYGYEYAMLIDHLISNIVNNPNL